MYKSLIYCQICLGEVYRMVFILSVKPMKDNFVVCSLAVFLLFNDNQKDVFLYF